MGSEKRIVLVGYDGAQSLDFVGPLEVFGTAERLSPGRYSIEVTGHTAEPFATNSGLHVTPERALAAVRGPIDTLVVAGGLGVRKATSDAQFVAAVAEAAGRSRRVTSVCTGAFLLARGGLLDGRRATTHWSSTRRLALEHPAVRVEPDRIFVRDEHVWTSAGVTAGMDLALALLEDDHGREAALEVARWLVLYVQRSGGQAQFSAPLEAQLADREPIREAQEHALSGLDGDLSVEALADRACMSVRNFSRAFAREVGMTPAAYVETVRVDGARRLLETTGLGTEAVATACGFGTVETFRRAFRRRLGVSPGEYRDRFRAAA